MAVRNNTRKKKSSESNLGCLLLLAFLLFMIGLALFNRENIGKTLKNTQFVERVLNRKNPPAEPAVETVPPAAPAVQTAPQPPATKPAAEPIETPPKTPQTKKPAAENPVPPQTKPAVVEPTKTDTVKTAPLKPKPEKREEEAAAARERNLWFVRVETDGVIARVKVRRKLAASDTPLVDALNALMTGPSADEKKKGFSSLIPAGTKLLSATVRGSTAYLNFNDQFQFNSYGIEGYAAQLRQIIWTATEFDSVKDVQFLIEGQRLDYLGAEGIFIGSPLGRDAI